MSVDKNIPKGWVETTLGEVAIINPRETIKKGDVTTNVPMAYLGNFTKKIQNSGRKEFKGGTKFRNGDTLIARITPCLENGKTAFVDILDDNEVGFGSTEYIVLREKDNYSDKHFLFYFSISPKFREIAIKLMTGTSGRQRVQTNSLMERNFVLPPLPEQKAIAKILTAFDDKIELLQAQNKTLETTAQTIFKEWFGKYQIGDELPEGWRVGKLGEEFDILMGQSPKGESYNEIGKGMVFFQGRAEFTERFPKKRLYTTAPKRLANKFDVLVSVRAPVGDVNVASETCCIGRGLSAVKSQNKSYALYKIKSLKPQFDLFESEGTVFGSINKDSFSNMAVVIPPEKKIKDFEKMVSLLDNKYFQNATQIQTLKQTRDTLLPKLMSGQLRVGADSISARNNSDLTKQAEIDSAPTGNKMPCEFKEK